MSKLSGVRKFTKDYNSYYINSNAFILVPIKKCHFKQHVLQRTILLGESSYAVYI